MTVHVMINRDDDKADKLKIKASEHENQPILEKWEASFQARYCTKIIKRL